MTLQEGTKETEAISPKYRIRFLVIFLIPAKNAVSNYSTCRSNLMAFNLHEEYCGNTARMY